MPGDAEGHDSRWPVGWSSPELGLISTSGREIRTRSRRTALPLGRQRESSSLSSQHQDRRGPPRRAGEVLDFFRR